MKEPFYTDTAYRGTFFLFDRPSFFEGVGRMYDFLSVFSDYNYSKSEAEADTKALESDWRAVGFDITSATEEYERKQLTTVA